MKTFIRTYDDEDFDQVNLIWDRTGMGGVLRGDNAVVIRNTLEHGGILFLLTTEKNKIIGTSWITNDGRRLYLHHFAIDPVYQGKGLSEKLLIASLDFARAKELQIKLEVHHENEAALHLYQSAGFQYLGDYDVYIIRNIQQIETE